MAKQQVSGENLDVEFLAWVASDQGHPVHVVGRAEDDGQPVLVLVAVGQDVERVLDVLSRRWPFRQDMGPPPSRRRAEED